MRRSSRWLRTDEREDAVRSLCWAAEIAEAIDRDPHKWKWELVALHNAVQGFMVLALSMGNRLLALRPDIATKWHEAYDSLATDSAVQFPAEKLDGFLNLYSKIKDHQNFSTPFVSSPSHDRSMKRLNGFRNEFVHFTPKGWSIELAGLPAIIADVIDVIEWCSHGAGSFRWHRSTQRTKSRSAVAKLRRVARQLQVAYDG